MKRTDRKMSDIMKELSEVLLRDPSQAHSSEAAHIALLFANIAWNECVGMGQPREGYRRAWEKIEAENPEFWNEMTSNEVDAMIDELVAYKKKHYPDDQRRILVCGIPDGRLRVEWVPPAAPGVDSRWEIQLYGLVRTNRRDEAIRFLQRTKGMSQEEAQKRIAEVDAHLMLCLPTPDPWR